MQNDNSQKQNVQIFVCHHKSLNFEMFAFHSKLLLGAYSNKAIASDYFDNTLINISNKNSIYCELTGLYWIWKNYNLDAIEWIGLSHYRRYFNFDHKKIIYPIQKFLTLEIKHPKKTYSEYLKHYTQYPMNLNVDWDVVVPTRFLLSTSLEKHYLHNHSRRSWIILKSILNETYSKELLDKFCNVKYLYSYNMFIMKKKYFSDFCEWLFSILAKVESEYERSNNNLESRELGFLSERLFTFWILLNNKNYCFKELPVIKITDI